MPDSPALASLQKQVDSRAYVAGPGHPAWAKALSSLALSNPGALALIGPAGISVTTDDGFRARAAIEPPALYLAALADTVAATHGKVALAYPPAASHLPLLFAVTAVLSTAINRAVVRDELFTELKVPSFKQPEECSRRQG